MSAPDSARPAYSPRVPATPPLPDGVSLIPLRPHDDDRGRLVELHRDSWGICPRPAQWNLVRSRAGTLRGIHAHALHWDVLHCVAGRMEVGVQDLRPDSPTAGLSAVVVLDEAEPRAIVVPPGVAHGFWFPADAMHLYGLSVGWTPDDELGCRWDDPALAIPWTPAPTLLSERDRGAGPFSAMTRAIAAHFAVRA